MGEWYTKHNMYYIGLGVYIWDQHMYREGTGAGSRVIGNN